MGNVNNSENEFRLLNFWCDKLNAEYENSAFAKVPIRRELQQDMLVKVSQAIWHGLPLTQVEFAIAKEFGYLLTDKKYEEFYKSRWHETRTHRRYGEPKDCPVCQREANSKGA